MKTWILSRGVKGLEASTIGSKVKTKAWGQNQTGEEEAGRKGVVTDRKARNNKRVAK